MFWTYNATSDRLNYGPDLAKGMTVRDERMVVVEADLVPASANQLSVCLKPEEMTDNLKRKTHIDKETDWRRSKGSLRREPRDSGRGTKGSSQDRSWESLGIKITLEHSEADMATVPSLAFGLRF